MGDLEAIEADAIVHDIKEEEETQENECELQQCTKRATLSDIHPRELLTLQFLRHT